jgi:two-component system chemotaxis response regulator CheB
MNKRVIRVLIVDDSPVIRALIADTLMPLRDMHIVGSAADGAAALKMLDSVRPDVITLDLQMPRLGGLETLDRLLTHRPTPVIVVSSLTQRAADTTLQALDRGAMDYIAKPDGLAEMKRIFGDELPQKIRNMAGTDVRRVLQLRQDRKQRTATVSKALQPGGDDLSNRFVGCIAIGVSTGGPPALSRLFASLTPPLPPIVVVQHMPQMFTGPFAGRLDSLSEINIKEAATGDILRPNTAILAPGGKHLSLRRLGGAVQAVVLEGEPVSGHKPSVDVMMQSVAQHFGKHALGVIMTGMGRDGADGCGFIREAGGYVLGQDEESSDVYGMNKVAFVEGKIDRQVSLSDLADVIAVESRRRCLRPGVTSTVRKTISVK